MKYPRGMSCQLQKNNVMSHFQDMYPSGHRHSPLINCHHMAGSIIVPLPMAISSKQGVYQCPRQQMGGGGVASLKSRVCMEVQKPQFQSHQIFCQTKLAQIKQNPPPPVFCEF